MNKESAGAIEGHHIDYIPESERKGKVWKQGPFWFLGNFQPFTVSIGLLGPVFGLTLVESSIAAILGVLFGTLFMAAHAAQGPRLGLPQMIQSRAQFGYIGVIFPLLATTFTFVAFNVVDVVILKVGLKGIFHWNLTLTSVAMTLIAVVLAIYGHDWLHKVFQILFWSSLPFWLILTYGIITKHAGGHGIDAGHFNWAGFLAMFAIAASYNITYAPYVSDYTRYLARDTSRSSLITAVFIGASGSPIWLMPLGSWLAIRLGATDALKGIYDGGNNTLSHAGTILAILSVLALVATMGINAYSGMLSVVTAIDSFKPLKSGSRVRIITIVSLAIIWLWVALVIASPTAALNNSLLYMLYLLAPWTAVNLIDFYAVRHGNFAIADFFTPSGIYGRWGVRGIFAYLVGILLEVPFAFIPGQYESWGEKQLKGVDISWIIGMVAAGLIYYILSKSLDLQAEMPAIEKSEAFLKTEQRLR